MDEPQKQWQATVWGGDPEKPTTFYGATLEQLSTEVSGWIVEQGPLNFANFPSKAPTRITYTKKSPSDTLQHLDEVLQPHEVSADALWSRTDPKDGRGWPAHESLSLVQAAVRFSTQDMCIEHGPEYREAGVQDGVLLPHCIKALRLETTAQGKNIPYLNLLLCRDWYVLKLIEKEGDFQLLLGHVEANAF